MGESIPDFPLPSPQQLGVSTAIPEPSSIQTHPPKKAASLLLAPVGKQKPAKDGFKRVVFLAHFEDHENCDEPYY